MTATADRWRIDGRVVVITGGAGMLGLEHAAAVIEAGGIPVLWDLANSETAAGALGGNALGIAVDITDEVAVSNALAQTLDRLGRVDALINNAAIDPKVSAVGDVTSSRLEVFPLESWNRELAVGLTGSFLCSRAIGTELAQRSGGVIVNIASDLGVIAPDQRLYQRPDLADDAQPVKPVTYSVIKHGLIGLTRYLATYWPDRGVRANALAPGGVYAGQPDAFVTQLSALIPMGRMARRDEYRGAIQFLCSDASSYMNGAVLVMEGGRSVW